MFSRASFESVLTQLAQAPVGFAAAAGPDALSPLRVAQGNEDPLDELRKALLRLGADASLGSGDPHGYFTYEDPILAVAALACRRGESAESLVGAAVQGERVRDGSLRFILPAISWWIRRGNKAAKLLLEKVSQKPEPVDKEVVRIAVVGDAGYRGTAQDRVFGMIARRHTERPFDYLIHLGDTYLGGGADEVLQNFLTPVSQFRNQGIRVYSLCGNHDLYYDPQHYADVLEILGQPGRYFMLKTPYWRIACLDTALAAERQFGNDGKVDNAQFAWLAAELEVNDPPLVLMSHHYIVSEWSEASPSLKDQLEKLVNAPYGQRPPVFAWYWGHEHVMAAYKRTNHNTFFGACIGNGVFLEPYKEPGQVRSSFATEWYIRGARCSCYGTSTYWPHGYLELELTGQELVETYHVENGSTWQRRLPRASSQSGEPRASSQSGEPSGRSQVGEPRASSRVGERILGFSTATDLWYPGRIVGRTSAAVVVKYDHDDELIELPENHVRKADNLVGQSVLRRAQNGRLLERVDERVRIQLETGNAPVAAALGEIAISDDEITPNFSKCESTEPGTRVLGRWSNEFWYPGRIAERKDDRFFVKFDDGDQTWLQHAHLANPDSAVGRAIWYIPRVRLGKVVFQEGEALCLELEGDYDVRQWTMLSNVRVPAEGMHVGSSEQERWQVGDRVLARWPVEQFWWYPARINACDGERYEVHFDDGDKARVTSRDLAPLVIDVGTRVFGRLNDGRLYFPGRVVHKEEERILIRYDDTTEQRTTISMVRIPRI
jgi:hypothetical protein